MKIDIVICRLSLTKNKQNLIQTFRITSNHKNMFQFPDAKKSASEKKQYHNLCSCKFVQKGLD